VLRKALGQGDVGRALHPSVQHMLLLGSEQGSWLATHPPIAERIRRIYGHTMGALDSEEHAPTRPDLIS
jgi:heat shock protein HtpX